MPDNDMTKNAFDAMGEDAPELSIFEILFAALTPQERVQEVNRLHSLLAKRAS